VDYDGDGYFDLLANRHWQKPRFYTGNKQGYRLSNEVFFSGEQPVFDRHSCAWGEANGDGHVDLYCNSGAQKGEGYGANQLWIQTESGFVNHSRRYGTAEGYGRSRTVNWIDYDSDGDLDVFVGNKLRRRAPNVMFRNDRGRFTKVEVGLSDAVNSLASTWADWDRDGDPDLLLARYRPEPAIAYENVDGSFQRIRLNGISGRHWSSASWGDFDGDGWPDVHLVAPRRSLIMRNASGSFEPAHSFKLQAGASSTWLDVDNDSDLDAFVVQGQREGINQPDLFLAQDGGFSVERHPSFRGPRAGSGETATAADSDRDGRLDLFVTNGALLSKEGGLTGRWHLLENRSRAGNWVALDLRGSDWNPWAFGARLHVQSKGVDYWRQINDGVGLRGQSGIGRHVLGIGSEDHARIRIEWPEGAMSCVETNSGTLLTVRSRAAGADQCL
jgi:hypothetical protein